MYFVLTLKGEMIMTSEEAFGKVLREIRHEHSLSQEELGLREGGEVYQDEEKLLFG